MSLEIERKYLNVNFDHLRACLGGCSAQGGLAHFESNLVFDTHESALFDHGKLLRLRTREWANREEHLLTLKMPATDNEQFKVREEIEIPVEDARKMEAILAGLGLTVRARYEKVREVWRYNNVEIVLDSLPFIQVVELEGAIGDICAVESVLHLDKAEKCTDSYHALHQAWLKSNCLPEDPNFVFEEEKRRTWRKKLGLKNCGGKDAVGI